MSNTGVNIRLLIPRLWKKLQGGGIGPVLARGASAAFAVSILGAVMAFGTNVLLARLMGVTQYGIYIYALTWINLLVLVSQLGMNTSLLRFIPAYNANAKWGLLRGVLTRSIQYVALASILIGVAGTLVVRIIYENIGHDQAITFWLAFFLLPILSLGGLRQAALRAFKRIVQSGLPDSLFRPLVIVVLASGVYAFSEKSLQADQVMILNIVAAMIALIIGTLWLIKALPPQLRVNKPIYTDIDWLKVSLPLFFMAGMSLILHKTDIIMIGIFLDAEHAGVYAIASRVAGLMSFGLAAANTIVAPMISELYSTGQYQKLQKMITYAARGIGVFTLIMGLCLAIMGEFLLGLFGEDFIAGYIPLVILICGQTINALAGSVGFIMIMTGHQKQAASIIGMIAMINIIGNYILIPLLGLLGAAITTAVATSLLNFIMLAYVLKRLNINPTAFACRA
ncbi:MAG: oligosaccharide flippase family protein [Gammaproteobacteria bacterium]|nr:oligosaccharide flippase family protein [Gammaproteobacteria bacterium]